MYKPLASIKRDRNGIAGFLLRRGIMRSPAAAVALLLTLCVTITAFSVFSIYTVRRSTLVVPYSELPSAVKNSFPVAVQKLHQNQL